MIFSLSGFFFGSKDLHFIECNTIVSIFVHHFSKSGIAATEILASIIEGFFLYKIDIDLIFFCFVFGLIGLWECDIWSGGLCLFILTRERKV